MNRRFTTEVGYLRARRQPIRDALVVLILTVVAAVAFSRLDLGERIFNATRRFEFMQLDELPALLLVLAGGLIWFASRRYRDAMTELDRRATAEQQLAGVLADNRRLARQHILAGELERKHLARELHDEAGQYLNAIKTDAIAIHGWAIGDPLNVQHAADEIVAHVDRVSGVVRELIHRLRPVALDELGLAAALEHHLEHWQQRAPQIRMNYSTDGQLDDLDEQVSLAIYRLTQEGLTNVVRHAEATVVDIHLTRQAGSQSPDELVFRMRDDGRGADLGVRQSGLGLVGMRERIEMFGGDFRVHSSPGCGFELLARVPITAAPAP